MLYTSNDRVTEPITLVEVRSFLSIEPTDQSVDAYLLNAVSMVRTRIEDMLPFWIADRIVTVKSPNRCKIPVKGEIGRIIKATLYHPDGLIEDVTDRCGFFSTPNGSCLYPPMVEDTAVEIEFSVIGYMNDTVRLALLTGVRNAYTNRSSNPITEEVVNIIGVLTPENI